MHKIQLLLTRAAATPTATFVALVLAESARLAADLPVGVALRAGGQLEDNPIASLPHAQQGEAQPGRGFEVLVELFAASAEGLETAVPLLGLLAAHLGDHLDRAASALIAGTEHHILPGWGSLQLVFALRRLPAMRQASFQDYWLHRHVVHPLGVVQRGGVLRYRQFHADDVLTARWAGPLGCGIADFDGVAEVYYRHPDEIVEGFSRPEVARDALEDERRFIDHARSFIGFYRIGLDTRPDAQRQEETEA